MTILESEVVLVASERLTEFDDGGGGMSGNVVVDGAVNNMFPDISRTDRVAGRVSLCKGFVAVRTVNTDTYYGAHVIVTDPPTDPHVNTTLFTTKSWTDERAAARNQVENYLAVSAVSRFVLYGDHLAGQRTVMVYCRAEAPSPEVGDVFCLWQEKIGYDTVSQYVRVTKLVSRIATVFTVSGECGTFSRDVIIFEISNVLRYKFACDYVTCLSNNGSPTQVRTTVVADAAQYYGVKPLAAPASAGDLSIKVPGIFGQIVPSTQIETPVMDTLAGMAKTVLVQSGDDGSLSVSQTFSKAANSPATLYFGSPFCRGSLSITSPAALTDDGGGNIIAAGGNAAGYSGTVNYESGAISLTRTSAWSGAFTATATPAGVAVDSSHTDSIAITASNRQYNYVLNLQPVPAPGTLTVDYRAQGKWVRLSDDGLGKLSGRDGEGSGTVNFATGSVLLTVGALVDVGSSIIYSWGSGVHYERHGINAGVSPVTLTLSCPAAFSASTLIITYTSGGVIHTVTDDGHGALTGAGAGTAKYASGNVMLIPTWIPDAKSTIDAAYSHTKTVDEGGGGSYVSAKDSAGAVAITISVVPIKPGTLCIDIKLPDGLDDYGMYLTDTDNGILQLFVYIKNSGDANLANHSGEWVKFITWEKTLKLNAGTVNYVTGEVVFYPDFQDQIKKWDSAKAIWEDITVDFVMLSPVSFSVSYAAAVTISNPGKTATTMPSTLIVDLTPTSKQHVVPGSVRIKCGTAAVIDRNGTLLANVNPLTNAGTPVGAINYVSGEMSFSEWGGVSNMVVVEALLTRLGEWDVNATVFRAPGSPVRPGSFYVRARTIDQKLLTGTATMNGDITGTGMLGKVEAETGVVNVGFGSWVEVATLTPAQKAASWYVAPVAPATLVWVPTPVLPDSIFFNCVVYSNMPLDADQLGLDPVRLPMDGRVPIFKSGNIVVIHNTVNTPMPASLTASQVIALPRNDLAYAILRDANGVKIPTSYYTVNPKNGLILMADALDLAAYAQPLVCEHRIEDMVLVRDVQITGDLSIVAPLSHSYDVAGSYVSSALLIGDMQARVSKFFSQYTWTGIWSDSLIGSGTTAKYNDIVYPVAVHNLGAIEERWAIIFTAATSFNIVGENAGVIAAGATTATIAPLNPTTGTPYFTLQKEGWGSGWAANNVVRFTTHAANFPIWIARTTTMGPAAVDDDNFKIQIRGDAD